MKSSDEKRRFSSARFYRLAKRLVIGTSILSILFFALSLYIYNFELGKMYKQNMDYCGEIPIGSSDLALNYWKTCSDNAESIVNFWTKSVMFSPIVALGLPIIFFVGVGFYKYVFPRIDNE